MVNASFLKRNEIAVRFLKTSKRSENRHKSIQNWWMFHSFIRSEINTLIIRYLEMLYASFS